jgi:hypothetical protein
MDARTDALVSSFCRNRSAETWLVDAGFVWKDFRIHVLLEVGIPRSGTSDGGGCQVLRHAWRIC